MHVYEQISFGADMINIVRIVCNCIALLTMRLLPGISPQYGAKWVSYPDPFSRWCTDTAGRDQVLQLLDSRLEVH